MGGYRSGPRFGFLGIFISLVVIGIIAAVAYNVGLSAGAAASGTGAPVVYGPWLGFGGFHFFGLLFFLLFFGLILAAIFRPRHWGGYGWRGGYGPGPWGWRSGDPRDVPTPVEGMLEDWHRRAHGEPTPPADSERRE